MPHEWIVVVMACKNDQAPRPWDAALEYAYEKCQPRLIGVILSGWCGLPLGG
jgi:hypothetical protein